MAQQTVSKVLAEVTNAIEDNLCPKHINLKMTNEQKMLAKQFFFEKYGIPSVIGAIDGVHIQIIRPCEAEHRFFNRKLKHSINAMVICDDKMKVRAVNGHFGGSCHDAHIWGISNEREYIKNAFESGDRCWILGDSAYPLEPWLMTPYRTASEGSLEAKYNQTHSKCKSIIERAFGLLKARFRCLLAARELHYTPFKTAKFLNVCCALHNVCIDFKVDLPEPTNIASDDFDDMEFENNDDTNIEAQRIRDQIKNML